MYYQNSTESIAISKIEDLLFIEIADHGSKEAEYSIQSENDRVIRRGRFKGRVTQLSLTHLSKGCYKLFLTSENNLITYLFEKQNNHSFAIGR